MEKINTRNCSSVKLGTACKNVVDSEFFHFSIQIVTYYDNFALESSIDTAREFSTPDFDQL